MGNHWFWLGLLLVLALIIFGPSRLPELGSALGRGIREFRKASEELREEVTRTTSPGPDIPASPPAAATTPDPNPPTA